MGYKIKEARQEKRMSQEELALKSGVSRATISALENGSERYVMMGTLVKLANALDTTIDKIFFVD